MEVHTGGKTVGLYIPQPVVVKRQCAPDQPISPVKMGPGMVPMGLQFKHLGSLIVADDCDGGSLKHRTQFGRFAFTELQSILGSKRVQPQVKRQLYESLVLQGTLYGSECWIVTAEHPRLLESSHRRNVRIMSRVTLLHSAAHHISAGELEDRHGLQSMKFYWWSRVLKYAGHVARMSPDALPRLLQRCWVEGGTQPTGGTKALFDSSLVQLLTRLDLDLRVAVSDRREWHDATQPKALAERWRRLYPGQSSLRNRAPAAPSASVIQASSGRSSSSSKLISLTPADMKRRILLTSTCLGEHGAWREKGESFRAERYLSILGQSLEQIKVKAIKVHHTSNRTCHSDAS